MSLIFFFEKKKLLFYVGNKRYQGSFKNDLNGAEHLI